MVQRVSGLGKPGFVACCDQLGMRLGKAVQPIRLRQSQAAASNLAFDDPGQLR